MELVIDILEEDIPKNQEIIDISLHFIAGEVCECNYPYIVLPKGHGRLIDEERISLSGIHFETERDHAMMIGRLNSAPTIIEAERA